MRRNSWWHDRNAHCATYTSYVFQGFPFAPRSERFGYCVFSVHPIVMPLTLTSSPTSSPPRARSIRSRCEEEPAAFERALHYSHAERVASKQPSKKTTKHGHVAFHFNKNASLVDCLTRRCGIIRLWCWPLRFFSTGNSESRKPSKRRHGATELRQ